MAAVQRLLSRPPGQATSTGTGLGLAIVRAVVERLGGRLTIAGAPGAGTSVTLQVPQPPLEPYEPPRQDPIAAEVTS
jgi:signal transduction histidine kinase